MVSVRRSRRIRRRVIILTLQVAVLLTVVELVLWGLYCKSLIDGRPHLEYKGHLEPNCVDGELLNLTGKTQPNYKTGSVCHYEPDKPEGAVRIGCFGDSFTYSFEVEDELDYPSLLERVLAEHDHDEVEVLNFGNDWFGFHQAWILFERLGLPYGLDYAIFGPQSFYPERDRTFCHAPVEAPYYVHGRYVLDGDGVRLVAPRGNFEFLDRFLRYHFIIPSWAQLRYDLQAPAFLKALLPASSRHRIANPFYYLSGDERSDETNAIYARLLASAPEDVKVFVGLYDREFAGWLERNVDAPGVVPAVVKELRSFPYKTAGYHNSPTGNLFLAQQYYNMLGLGDPVPLTLIETATVEAPADPVAAADPLHGYDELRIELDGVRAGGFSGMVPPFMAGELDLEKEDAWQRGEIDLGTLPREGAAAALALLPPGSSILDAAFLPLGALVEHGAAVALHCDGQPAPTTLGEVVLLAPQLGYVMLRGDYLSFHAQQNLWTYQGELPTGCSSGELLVGGSPVMRMLPGRSGADLRPLEGDLYILRGSGDVLLEPEPGEQGTVELVLARDDAAVSRHVIARWSARRL